MIRFKKQDDPKPAAQPKTPPAPPAAAPAVKADKAAPLKRAKSKKKSVASDEATLDLSPSAPNDTGK